MKNPVRTGTMVALAAASLFAVACKKNEEAKPQAAPTTTEVKPAETKPAETADKPAVADGEKMAKVHCGDINACKGQGGCKSAANACAGKNGCKGHGFVEVDSEDDCKAKGGSVITAGM